MMLCKRLVGGKVRVEFSITAYEGEQTACLVGDFNEWALGATPMSRQENGRWQVTLDLEPDRFYHYRYLIDEQNWHNDPDADGYVRDEFGVSTSVVSTSLPASGVQTSLKHFTPAQSDNRTYQRVLMPFTSTQMFQEWFDPAVEMVQRLGEHKGHDAPELILLRVRASDGCHYANERERVYSELRGIQARLQSCEMPSRIDTVSGPTASSIVDYAGRHAVDLIIMPGKQEEQVDTAVFRDIVHQVAHAVRCDTLVVE